MDTLTSSGLITKSIKSSDLSRNSAEAFEAADAGPVVVTRRDGEDLILATRHAVESERMGVRMASILVAASLAPDDVPFADRLADAFPWIEFLSAEHRSEFADEIVSVARACASVSRYERLLITLKAWKDSAEAAAAGWADAPVDWLDEGEDVPDPRA